VKILNSDVCYTFYRQSFVVGSGALFFGTVAARLHYFYCCLRGWNFNRKRLQSIHIWAHHAATGWAGRRLWLFKNMQHAAEESEVCIASAFIIFCLPRGCARSLSWKNKRALNHWRVLRPVDPFCPPQTAHTPCHGDMHFSFTFFVLLVDFFVSALTWIHHH
jgi:hypothetical protein